MTEKENMNWLLETMDANIWATEFCKKFPDADHGTMLAWFSCAIMTGFDKANLQNEALSGIE